MFGLGVTELLLIIGALGVLFFGGKRITELGRSLGRFTGEFKKGRMDIEKELEEIKQTTKSAKGKKNKDDQNSD